MEEESAHSHSLSANTTVQYFTRMIFKYSNILSEFFMYAVLIHSGICCIPFGAFNPTLAGAGYNAPYLPRVGPYRSEAQRYDPHSNENKAVHVVQAMHDQINSISSLNCGTFSENCRWKNTNDEELNWTTMQALHNAEQILTSLGVENYPDPASAALVSSSRPGWEGGQLVSDPLPCLSDGIRITATAWKSHIGPSNEQPKLQVCSKNLNEAKFPLINCNEFDIKNGVPLTVDVPAANNPSQPAQIVFYGNNFVAPQGGAIFLQDIVLEGTISCNDQALDSHPILVGGDFLQKQLDDERLQPIAYTSNSQPTGALKIMDDVSGGFGSFADESTKLDKSPKKFMILPDPITRSNEENSLVDTQTDSSLDLFSVASTTLPVNLQPISSELLQTCLALSCNPSDLSCNFWRSSGKNRWEIGSADRVANPLTGIHSAPDSAQKFLVAPFLNNQASSYTLVSKSLTIPLIEAVFFCFHEYIATYGLVLSVCTDKMDCFYKKNTLILGDAIDQNKRWNIRCIKLPAGEFELRVIAENLGENKGEIGFLPIGLSRDSTGHHSIC